MARTSSDTSKPARLFDRACAKCMNHFRATAPATKYCAACRAARAGFAKVGLPWASPDICVLIAGALRTPAVRKAGRFCIVDARDGVQGTRTERLAVRLPVTCGEHGEAITFDIPATQIIVSASLNERHKWALRPPVQASLSHLETV